jgi:TRAP-type C4-dicarboxylate transport system substrate-binding protein
MHRRTILLGAAAAASGAGLPPAANAQAARWQFATPFPDSNFHTQNVREFVADMEASSSGRVSVTLHTNASLIRAPEIKRGVQSGQVQLGEVLISAYANEDPMFEVDAVPMLVTSMVEARILARLQRPFVQARLERQGMTLLYMVPWPGAGFFTRAPLASLEGLRRTRFRAFNAATERFATLVGAAPTLVQVAEIAQAFATGIVNTIVTSASLGVSIQAWDFTTDFVPVGFTRTKNMVFCSTRALNALPADVQQAIQNAAERAEQRGWAMAEEQEGTPQKQLAERGMRVTDPAPPALMEGLARIGDTMVNEWLEKAGPDGRRLIESYRAAIARPA